MDPGYRSPLIEVFRRADTPRDVRLLAARGALSPVAHEQLALLVLLADEADPEIAAVARATIQALPVDALRGFLGRSDVPLEMKHFFQERGVRPNERAVQGVPEPLIASDEDDGEDAELAEGSGQDPQAPTILSGLPVKVKMKLAFKGTREQRAQLIRDPNRIVAVGVLSSPKVTESEIEAFAKMANVCEDVLRIIGTNRTWLKNYGTVLGLLKNPKTPPAISMQLLHRVNERDMRMLSADRNIPEPLKLAARKFVVKGLK